MLLWACMHKFLLAMFFVCLFVLFHLDTYLEVEFLGHIIPICLTFWGYCQTVFSKAAPPCTILHSHKQCIFLISPHSYPILWAVIFIVGILMSVKWYLLFFICISLMNYDIEHLFMCSLAICVSSLEKFLLNSLTNFKLGYFSFYCWIISSLKILKISLLFHI